MTLRQTVTEISTLNAGLELKVELSALELNIKLNHQNDELKLRVNVEPRRQLKIELHQQLNI